MSKHYISKRYWQDKSTAMGKSGEMAKAFDDVINKTLTTLNSYGVKNTYGYEITIKSGQSLGGNETYNTEVYKVKGEASDDKTFKNPVIVE